MIGGGSPLTSLLGFVRVLHTVTSSLYLAFVSIHMAVGRFRSPVWRSGIRCLTSSEILRVVLTVLISFLRQSCLVFTNVTCALEVFLNVMRYINPRFTYLQHSSMFTLSYSDRRWYNINDKIHKKPFTIFRTIMQTYLCCIAIGVVDTCVVALI